MVLLLALIGAPDAARAQLPIERLGAWIEASEPAITACARSERRANGWFRSEPERTTRAQEAPAARAGWSACVVRAIEAGRPRELATAYVWVTCGLGPRCDAFGFLRDELDDHGLAWALEEQLETSEALAACGAADSHIENLAVLLESPLDRPRARYLGDWRGPLPSERSVGECYARAMAAHRFVRPLHYSSEPPALRIELDPAFGGRFHPPSVRVAGDADRARARP